MQIEITGETERLIHAALAAGKFASVDEIITSAVKSSGIGIPSISAHSFMIENHSIYRKLEPSQAGEQLATWEDYDVMAEAWQLNQDGIVPASLPEIQAAMSVIKGRLSDDICEGRDERQ